MVHKVSTGVRTILFKLFSSTEKVYLYFSTCSMNNRLKWPAKIELKR